jgi:hypothetical protein
MLRSVKQNPIPAVPGQLLGMSQAHANQGGHRLPAVVHPALAHPELLPARHADDVAVMRAAKRRAGVPPPPLCGLRALSDRATAPAIPRTSRNPPAARQSATRSRTSSCSRKAVTAAACVPRRQGRPRRKAWRRSRAIPALRGVGSSTRGACRAFSSTGSPSSNRRENRLGVTSPHRRQRGIGRARRAASGLTRLGVG